MSHVSLHLHAHQIGYIDTYESCLPTHACTPNRLRRWMKCRQDTDLKTPNTAENPQETLIWGVPPTARQADVSQKCRTVATSPFLASGSQSL